MTVAIADFALSPGGQVFATVARYWGMDPGDVFPDDDVLAFNLRAGLMVGTHQAALAEPAESGEDSWESEGDRNRREWKARAAAQVLEARRMAPEAAGAPYVDGSVTAQQTPALPEGPRSDG
jgi:hypothetical protein